MSERKIKTPEKLIEHFHNYVKEAKAKPILVHDFVGKDGHAAYRQREKPLTTEGFWLYMYRVGVKDVLEYLHNRKGYYDKFIEAAQYIKNAIREDQITGGMVGIYHHNITNRLNGLVEKSENKHEVTEIVVKEQ